VSVEVRRPSVVRRWILADATRALTSSPTAGRRTTYSSDLFGGKHADLAGNWLRRTDQRSTVLNELFGFDLEP